MFNTKTSFLRMLPKSLLSKTSYNSFCKCAQCFQTYVKFSTKNSSVFSIKLTESDNKSFRSKQAHYLFAGLLTWLGLKKEEEDPMVSVIKLGILSLNKKEFDKAENILHLALKLAQQRQDMQAQRYIFDILANVAFEKGDLVKAEKLFIQVTKELLAAGTPQNDNAIVEISLKLASIYGQQKKMDKAETGFKFCISTQQSKLDGLDIQKSESFSQEEKDTVLLWAMSVDWYARHLLSTGQLAMAKDNFVKALSVSERINGPSHPQTLVLLNDVGSVLNLLGENEAAIECFQKAIERSEECPDLPAFYCNLGATLLETGNISEAERACRTALRLAKKLNHPVAEADAQECLKQLRSLKSRTL